MAEVSDEAGEAAAASPLMIQVPERELKHLKKRLHKIEAAAGSLYLALDCHIQEQPDGLLSNRVVTSFNRMRDALASARNESNQP